MTMYFSSGQAAEQLQCSQDYIRRLCQAGAIKAELSPGGQFRIPESEVQRLKQTGLPPMPRPLPGDRRRPAISTSAAPPGLYAAPSEELIKSAEQTVLLTHELKALRLTRRKEIELDHLRNRELRLRREEAEAGQAEQARTSAVEAELQRQDWLRVWEQFALDATPRSAGPELRLAIHAAVRAKLGELDPIPLDATCRGLIETVIAVEVQRAEVRQESATIIQVAMHNLPYDLQYGSTCAGERDEVLAAMTAAVAQLPADASSDLKAATARRVAMPIVQRFQHRQACEAILRGLPQLLAGATKGEREAGVRAVGVALEQLPPETSRAAMETVRDKVLQPLLVTIRQRLEIARQSAEEARRLQTEDSRRMTARLLVLMAMGHVDEVLRRLEVNGELEFEGAHDRRTTAAKLKERIKPQLVQEVGSQPRLSGARLMGRIEALVEQHLDSVCASE